MAMTQREDAGMTAASGLRAYGSMSWQASWGSVPAMLGHQRSTRLAVSLGGPVLRWFSSDLHLGHDNISRRCGRPFNNVHDMHVAICRNLNARVGPEDELWLLGDVAVGNLEVTLPILRRLKAGRLVMVAGNHDRIHPIHKSRGERDRKLYSEVFYDVIVGHTSLVLLDGTVAQVSHFPYWRHTRRGHAVKGPGADDGYARWRPTDDGSWLLCGHDHHSWRQRGRQINVGIDAWGGFPVSEEDLVRVIAAGPADRDALRWRATRMSQTKS